MSKLYPSQYAPIPLGDLENMNTDRTPDYPVMIRGTVYKNSADEWIYTDGQSRSYDATYMRVSAIGGTTGLSANQQVSARVLEGTAFIGSTSAVQGAAGSLRVSAFSDDAALMRVSALGVTTTSDPLSADGSSVSAKQQDAANLRISAFSTAANTLMVSGRSDDAQYFRVSAFGVTLAAAQTLSATMKEGTSFIGQVSATLKAGTASIGLVSATLKEGTAFVGQVSAILRDNATTATYLGRVSGIQGDAANMNVSAKSDGANLFRTSSYLPVDTVGQMTAFRTLSLSASQAVKATAGAVYGYYLWNTTTVPQYVKFTNTSGAINVGTDVPVFMAMIPASAGANVWFGQGIKGFTAGIGVHASSAVADNATTPAAASAVGGTIFYN